MEYEPLDSLPYVDQDLRDEERAQVQELINKELKNQRLDTIHPQVDALYPLPPVSSLVRNVSSAELEDPAFTLGGVDIQHYSNLDNDESIQQSIAYTYLRQSSLKVHQRIANEQWLLSNELHEQANSLLKDEVSRKRRRVTELNAERQRVQAEAKPVMDYLQERWVQSVQKNIQFGVGILEEQHGERSSGF